MSKIEEKQAFLHSNILGQGYDGQAFVDHAERQLGCEIDLQVLSIQQLRQIVDSFLASVANNSQQLPVFQENEINPEKNNEDTWQAWTGQKVQKEPDSTWIVKDWPKDEVAVTSGSLGLDLLDMLDSQPCQGFDKGLNQPKALQTPIDLKMDVFQFEPIKTVPLPQPQQKAQQNVQHKAPPASEKKDVKIQTAISPTTQTSTNKKTVQQKYEFVSEVKCRKLSLYDKLEVPNLQVIIPDTSVRSQGIFKFNYVVYVLHVKPFNMEVQRRFSDFQLLRTSLATFFPNLKIPLLEKASRLNEADPDNIVKQKELLQCFMAGLLQSPILRRSKFIEDFFLTTNSKEFKYILKEMSKVSKPKSIQELFNVEGKQDVKLDPTFQSLTAAISGLIDYSEIQLQKIKHMLTQVSSYFSSITSTLMDISNTFRNYQANICSFNKDYQSCSIPVFEKVLSKLAQLHHQLAEVTRSQGFIFENMMKTSLKYQRTNLVSLRDIVKTRNALADEVTRRGIKSPGSYQPRSSKQKGYVDYPSKDNTVLLYQLGAYNSIVQKQSRSGFNHLGCSLNGLFKSFGRLKISSLDTAHRIWQDMVEF